MADVSPILTGGGGRAYPAERAGPPETVLEKDSRGDAQALPEPDGRLLAGALLYAAEGPATGEATRSQKMIRARPRSIHQQACVTHDMAYTPS